MMESYQCSGNAEPLDSRTDICKANNEEEEEEMESSQIAENTESVDLKTDTLDKSNCDAEILNDQLRMFENIALSSARIKNQQQDEEDLPTSERINILKEQFHNSQSVFIEKFHPYLCEDDLQCFDTSMYEVSFYLKEVQRRLGSGKTPVQVKNRRYEALKKLEKEGTYFSDDEMRARDPLLYEQLIGQYQTDEERLESRTKIDQTDLKFSTILMTFMQDQEVKELYRRQEEREEEAEEEEEEEEDEEVEEKPADGRKTDHSMGRQSQSTQKPVKRSVDVEGDDEDEMEEDEEEEEEEETTPAKRQPTPATEAEKHLLREEFQNIMRERFLSGGDEEFDYGAVDNNAEYDSLVIRGWDEEEKYFDDEDEEDAEGGRINERTKDGYDAPASRTDNHELDDYEKWTPDETPME